MVGKGKELTTKQGGGKEEDVKNFQNREKKVVLVHGVALGGRQVPKRREGKGSSQAKQPIPSKEEMRKMTRQKNGLPSGRRKKPFARLPGENGKRKGERATNSYRVVQRTAS